MKNLISRVWKGTPKCTVVGIVIGDAIGYTLLHASGYKLVLTPFAIVSIMSVLGASLDCTLWGWFDGHYSNEEERAAAFQHIEQIEKENAKLKERVFELSTRLVNRNRPNY